MKSTQEQIKHELMDWLARSYDGIPEQLTPNELNEFEKRISSVSYWLQIAYQRNELRKTFERY